MVGPAAANPFAGTVVAATPEGYHHRRVALVRQAAIAAQPAADRATCEIRSSAAASRTPAARDYLTWSRYPYFEIEPPHG